MTTKKKLGKFASMELKNKLLWANTIYLTNEIKRLHTVIDGVERQLTTAQRSLTAFQRFDRDLEALLISVRGGQSMKIRSF